MESPILTTPHISTPSTSEFDANAWVHEQLQRTEQALSAWVGVNAPANLGESMRYAVLDGGKRLRPLLVLAAAQSVELGATNAYLGVIPTFENRDLAKVAGRLAADETMHYTALVSALGRPLPSNALSFGS